MIMRLLKILCLALILTLLSHPSAFSQQSASLKEGINQYREENFEEAIEVLIKARQEDPTSSAAAFFLGLAYKQVMDYPKAYEHLQEAVTLTPKIKEALVELIDVALQLEKLEEAKKWIGVAEEQGIAPAKVAFLKGLALSKEGKNLEAVESYENAKSIDETMAQAVDVQIALSYLKARELKKAKERFQAAVLHDPQTDLGGFARRYQDMVEERIFLERPFRFTLGVHGQYDSNMLLRWNEYPPIPWTGGDEKSRVLNTAFWVNYVPVFQSPWLFNAQYAFTSSVHQKNTHTHDSLSNSITLTPGYNFGRYSLNLATGYSHTLLRNPSYQRYLGSFSSGPLIRVALKQNQLLELYGGLTWNDYFRQPLDPSQFPPDPDEDRDSTDVNTYVSWIWLFKKDAFLNLRYQFIDQDTDGAYWDNKGHKFSINIIVPVPRINKVSLQLSGQAYLQDYKNHHAVFDVTREDDTYTFSGGFTWDFYKNASFVAQYTRTEANSNIFAYDYERDLYSGGIEYRF